MRLFETYQLEEATTPLDIKPNDIALMTKEEFLEFQNPQHKMHPPTAYDWTVEDMNERYGSTKSIQNYGDVVVEEKENGFLVKHSSLYGSHSSSKPFAVIHNGTAYYTQDKNKIPVGLIDRMNDVDIHYGIENYKRVKYLSDYIELIDPTTPIASEYPEVINRKKFGDQFFELRKRNSHGLDALAIINEAGQVVAVAQDEWGASLVSVAQEYRGYGLDQWISEAWYELHPDYTSGGYTPAGEQHDLRRWSNRVRKFLSNGWYSELIDQGLITKEKVRKIVSQIKPKKEYKKPEKKKEDGNLLIRVDYPSFILYDDQYLEDNDPEHIKAFGFLRSFDDNYFVYRLEYERGYEKLAKTIILQLFKDNHGDEWLEYDIERSDLIEIDDLDNVEIENGKVRLVNDQIDLTKAKRVESVLRKKHTTYPNEISDKLIEDAEYKDWQE